MSEKRFELSIPKSGWLDITIKDEETSIKFPVSYLCDPVYMLLNTFVILLEYKKRCTESQEYKWMPYPSIYFEGEGTDTYVTLGYNEIVVNVIKDNIYQSHAFLMDWEEIMKDVMGQLTDEYIEAYCNDWYDKDDADDIDGVDDASELKGLIRKVRDLQKILEK